MLPGSHYLHTHAGELALPTVLLPGSTLAQRVDFKVPYLTNDNPLVLLSMTDLQLSYGELPLQLQAVALPHNRVVTKCVWQSCLTAHAMPCHDGAMAFITTHQCTACCCIKTECTQCISMPCK